MPGSNEILQKLEEEVRCRGWDLDNLYSSLQKSWDKYLEIDGQPVEEVEGEFDDVQKSLLCLNLNGNSLATAAGQLLITSKTCTEYCSKKLYKGITKVYLKNIPKTDRVKKIKWDNIKYVCKQMNFDLYDKMIEHLRNGRIRIIADDPDAENIINSIYGQEFDN